MKLNIKEIKNDWLRVNFTRIEEIKTRCLTFLMGSVDGSAPPYNNIISFLDLMMFEIEKLQTENNELKKK